MRLPALLLAVALVTTVDAQQRDRTSEPPGTATISGIVTNESETPTPLRRAIVSVSGGELALARTSISDDAGRFAIRNLPAGRYTLTASKPAYITTTYGARRPGRTGTAIALANGQQMTDVALRLPRGAVISGTLRDTLGQPTAGAQISVVAAPASLSGSINAPSVGTVTTDDRGGYRVFGLLPGPYLVVATSPMSTGPSAVVTSTTEAEVDAALAELRTRSMANAPTPPRRPADPATPRPTAGFASVFYPGTAVIADATKVTVTTGEVRTGLDFVFSLTPTSTIEGVITNPYGPLPPYQIAINAESGMRLRVTRDTRPGAFPQIVRDPADRSRFKYINVAPGRYTIAVMTAASVPTGTPGTGRAGDVRPVPAGSQLLWATADVTVSGETVSGLTLTLRPAMRLRGRVEFDAAILTPPIDPSAMTVRLTSTTSGGSGAINNTQVGTIAVPPGQVRPDGTFEILGVFPGAYYLTSVLPGGWWLRSAMINGRDVLDYPIEFAAGRDQQDMVLTFTDRRSELSGTLQTADGAPAPDFFVAVFPANKELWRAGSRRIQSARPGLDGKYTIRDLPAGDYLLAALTDLDPVELMDPAFLQALVGSAIKVGIGEGGKVRKDIKLAR